MINTEIWTSSPDPNGQPDGYLHYIGQRTLRQVEADLMSVLKTIQAHEPEYIAGEYVQGSSAYDLMEWCSTGNYATSDDFPRGQILVTVCQGSCEGRHIVILSRQRNGTAATVFAIKYLIGAADVWRIAQQLDREFEIH